MRTKRVDWNSLEQLDKTIDRLQDIIDLGPWSGTKYYSHTLRARIKNLRKERLKFTYPHVYQFKKWFFGLLLRK